MGVVVDELVLTRCDSLTKRPGLFVRSVATFESSEMRRTAADDCYANRCHVV